MSTIARELYYSFFITEKNDDVFSHLYAILRISMNIQRPAEQLPYFFNANLTQHDMSRAQELELLYHFSFRSLAIHHFDEFWAWHIRTATYPKYDFPHIDKECGESFLEISALHCIEKPNLAVANDVLSISCSAHMCEHVWEKLKRKGKEENNGTRRVIKVKNMWQSNAKDFVESLMWRNVVHALGKADRIPKT